MCLFQETPGGNGDFVIVADCIETNETRDRETDRFSFVGALVLEPKKIHIKAVFLRLAFAGDAGRQSLIRCFGEGHRGTAGRGVGGAKGIGYHVTECHAEKSCGLRCHAL